MHISSAAAKLYKDLCDRTTYGQPNYSSCVLLLFGNRALTNKRIYNIDNEDHGFLLPYFSGRSHFTINNGGMELLYHPCGRTVRRMSKLLPANTSCVDECKIALVVHSLPRGGFTTGTGTWSEIADRVHTSYNQESVNGRLTYRLNCSMKVKLAIPCLCKLP